MKDANLNLLFIIEKVLKKFKQGFRKYLREHHPDVHLDSVFMLLEVYKKQGISQKKLAFNLNKDPAVISRKIKNLEKLTYIQRKKEGKNNLIYLAPVGFELAQAINIHYVKFSKSFFDDLIDREVNLSVEILKRLLNE